MSNSIQILGLQFVDGGNGKFLLREPRPDWMSSFDFELRILRDMPGKVTVRVKRIYFQIASTDIFFELRLGDIDFRPDSAANDTLTPESFNASTGDRSLWMWQKSKASSLKQPLHIDIGPFHVSTDRVEFKIDSPFGGGARDVWVRLTADATVIRHPSCPVELIHPLGSQLRLHSPGPDAQLPELHWERQALKATTWLGNSEKRRVKNWFTGRLAIPVNELPNAHRFQLMQDASGSDVGEPLLLYPFEVNEEGKASVLAAMGLDAQSLELGIGRETGANRPQLQSLAAVTPPAGVIHCYGLATRDAPGYLRIPAQPRYELGVRIARSRSISSGIDVRVPGLLLMPIDMTRSERVVPPVTVLGVRPGLRVAFHSSSLLEVSEPFRDVTFSDPLFANSVLLDTNAPQLRAGHAAIDLNRPGVSMRDLPARMHDGITIADVRCFAFRNSAAIPGERFRLPLVPDAAIHLEGSPTLAQLHADANRRYAVLVSDNSAIEHESRMLIEPPVETSKFSLAKLFRSSHGLSTHAQPGLGEHANVYRIGPYTVSREWSVGGAEPETAEYVVLRAGDVASGRIKLQPGGFDMDSQANIAQSIRLSAISDEQQTGLCVEGDGKRIIGLLKLGRQRTLFDLLRAERVQPYEIEGPPGGDPEPLANVLPASVRDSSWVGLVLFSQELDLSEFKLLRSLLPDPAEHPTADVLRLRYLAVSPAMPGNADQFVTYGMARWINPKAVDPEWSREDQEVRVRMHEIEVVWAARRLVRFYSKARVDVRSVLGIKTSDAESSNTALRSIDVLGGIDRRTGTITFLAQADKPIQLLPAGGLGPLKSLSVHRVEVTREGERTVFDADGDIELQDWSGPNGGWSLGAPDLPRLHFRGLGFGYVGRLSALGQWLSFEYPSMRFQLGKGWNLLGLDWIRVQLTSLGFDVPELGRDFDWGRLLGLLGTQADWATSGGKMLNRLRFGFDLSVGRLPLLTTNPFDSLRFGFELGFPIKLDGFDLELDSPRLFMRAFGFEGMDLDLMRFLRIRVKKAEAKNDNGTFWLLMQQCEVLILQKTIIDDLTLAYFSGNGESGFVGLYGHQATTNSGMLDIDWVLVGRNLSIESSLAKQVISIAPASDSNLHTQLENAWNQKELHARPHHRGIGEWLFAAGFRVLGEALHGKFLFQDKAYYGLAIEGTLLKKWFGYDLAMSVLYVRGQRPEEDMFRLEVRVPSVDAGGISFNGGVIAVEIQVNGGFLIDVGYPWLASNGERRWDRGFGMMLSGLMGRGGMIIAKREAARIGPAGDGEGQLLLVEGGLAGMVGIGASFNGGIFRVSAYAGIYFVAEGALLFNRSAGFDLRLVGARISGAIGIQVRAIGELKWWIISIRIEIVVGAEARLTVYWGLLKNHDPSSPTLPGYSGPPDGRITVRVNFVLYARVSARACIGSGWFKVCKSISTGVSMPYQQDLLLG